MPSAQENFHLACAVCKIGLYSVFCRMCCKASGRPRPEFEVICLGLTEAGKSALIALLCKESTDCIEPTTGFIIKAVQFPNCILNIKEIGGGEKVRPFWHHYYKDAQGMIFVIDSASPSDEFEDARSALHEVLSSNALQGLPCLILANCQDKQFARNEQQIREELQLSKACEDRPWALHLCSLKDIELVRDGFTKLNVFLIAPDDNTKDTNNPSQKDSRV